MSVHQVSQLQVLGKFRLWFLENLLNVAALFMIFPFRSAAKKSQAAHSRGGGVYLR